jgi:hypothetical protein
MISSALTRFEIHNYSGGELPKGKGWVSELNIHHVSSMSPVV